MKSPEAIGRFAGFAKSLAAGAIFIAASNTFAAERVTPSTLSLSSNSNSAPAQENWSIELSSGATFANVRAKTLDDYTLVPTELTLSHEFNTLLMEKPLGGVLEGHPVLSIGGYYTVVASGVEHYIAGCHLGTKYNFMHFSKRFVPFMGWNIGLAWADAHQYLDASAKPHGLGQDFNFNFEVVAGMEYRLTERSYVRFTAVYTHYSNAGLSLPEHYNRAIDAAGPMMGMGWRF